MKITELLPFSAFVLISTAHHDFDCIFIEFQCAKSSNGNHWISGCQIVVFMTIKWLDALEKIHDWKYQWLFSHCPKKSKWGCELATRGQSFNLTNCFYIRTLKTVEMGPLSYSRGLWCVESNFTLILANFSSKSQSVARARISKWKHVQLSRFGVEKVFLRQS